jgi:hypothetical protein
MRSASGARTILIWGTTFSLFLLVSYATCIVLDRPFPQALKCIVRGARGCPVSNG